MNKQEHDKHLSEFKKACEEMLSSKEQTKKVLLKANIITEDGNLTDFYSEKRNPIGFIKDQK